LSISTLFVLCILIQLIPSVLHICCKARVYGIQI
jgi:hypothetical protein